MLELNEMLINSVDFLLISLEVGTNTFKLMIMYIHKKTQSIFRVKALMEKLIHSVVWSIDRALKLFNIIVAMDILIDYLNANLKNYVNQELIISSGH